MRKPIILVGCCLLFPGLSFGQSELPFSTSIDTYRSDAEDDDVRAFVVKLDQPFLAEEFEKSNYIRIKTRDNGAFLVYPRETRFEQRHAEFYGRLRGEDPASIEISYEVVSENPDGSRRIDSRSAVFRIDMPQPGTGSPSVYTRWAEEQNDHFAHLLEYYPNESFFEYLLLQSRERYGVTPPALSRLMPNAEADELNIYHTFSAGLELQRSLQRSSLRGTVTQGDLSIHLSQVKTPGLKSPDYESLLNELSEDNLQPAVPDSAQLVPADQYFLQFNSWKSAQQLYDASERWFEPVMRMITSDARDHELRSKYEQQLMTTFGDLEQLFADGTVSRLTVTGSDFYIGEGTDLSLILETTDAESILQLLSEKATALADVNPEFEDRRFNYRGMSILARYTTAREISCFVFASEGFVVISNSHVAVRRIADCLHDRLESLAGQDDFRCLTALHPSSDDAEAGYSYFSDAFLRYLVSPEFKIGERRRKQSLNNLVMLNNASLFHRLEYGTAPSGLDALVDGRFIDRDRVICPQGGAYSFDPGSDSAVSSVFNRIRYLTPIRELRLLRVSSQEQKEYDRYRSRYESAWRDYFSPLAFRFTAGDDLTVEYCTLPFANGAQSKWLKSVLGTTNGGLKLQPPAKSAIATMSLATGRDSLASWLRMIPGVREVLEDDPTLTDLQWLGERASLTFCDSKTLLEIDPTQLAEGRLPLPLSTVDQAGIAAAVFAVSSPVALAVEVGDREKADRFLRMLASRIFLHGGRGNDLLTPGLDSYRLPPHRDHNVYAVTFRIYAARVRLYLSAVADQLVICTAPEILRQVIDASLDKQEQREAEAQFAVQIRPTAMLKFRSDLQTYWEENSRQASHDNIMPLYTLIHLYNVPPDRIDELSRAKYGVTYFCPDGEYRYDPDSDQVTSTAYGNRENALQDLSGVEESSFDRTFDSIGEILFTLNLTDRTICGAFTISGR